jgi:hypothetical protein
LIRFRQLSIITCKEDNSIKLWSKKNVIEDIYIGICFQMNVFFKFLSCCEILVFFVHSNYIFAIKQLFSCGEILVIFVHNNYMLFSSSMYMPV